MPWGDGTGPWWAGERVSGGSFRRSGMGWGCRRWFGWGMRNRIRWFDSPSESVPEEERKAFLEDRIKFLEEEVNRTKNELDSLKQ